MTKMKSDRWWRTMVECDPITLEPLADLDYPPFKFKSMDHGFHFDGQMLAHYLVSTGTFVNPMNRVPLKRQDCVDLDMYLNKHGLKPARVADAYDLKQMLTKKADRVNQEEVLRREATIVFHSLFDFGRYSDRKRNATETSGELISLPPPPPPPTSLGLSNIVHEEKGLRVIDGDAWVHEENSYKDYFPALEAKYEAETKPKTKGGGQPPPPPPPPPMIEEPENEELVNLDEAEAEVAAEEATPKEKAISSVSVSSTLRQRKKKKAKTVVKQVSTERLVTLDRVKKERHAWFQGETKRRNYRKRVLRSSLLGLLLSCLVTKVIWELPGWAVFGQFFAGIVLLLAWAKRIDETKQPNVYRHADGGLSWGKRPGNHFGVTILALGTRGDVEPLLALGVELMKQNRAIQIMVCAPGEFKELVNSRYERLKFVSCGIDHLEPTKEWADATSMSSFMKVISRQYAENFDTVAQGFWNGCKVFNESDHHTDAILAGTFAIHFALDIAEALAVPCWGVKFAPDSPSSDQPPFGTLKWRHFPWNLPIVTKARYVPQMISALIAANQIQLTSKQNAFRKDILDLHPLTHERLQQMQRGMPVLYVYSPNLLPRPKDLPMWQLITGFLLTINNDKSKEQELEEFLQGSSSPVCITFGSMHSALEHSLMETCVEAVFEQGRKCVVVCPNPTEDLKELETSRSRQLKIFRSIPHDLLFPRCACVIHHGGAGTTGRTLYHGVPSIIIPILTWYDQRGWALAVEEQGSGIYLNLKSVSKQTLHDVINTILLTPSYRQNARDLANRMQAENAVHTTANIFLTTCLCDKQENQYQLPLLKFNCIKCNFSSEHATSKR